jgi:hypothetical protein
MISACRKDFRLAFDRPHASPKATSRSAAQKHGAF